MTAAPAANSAASFEISTASPGRLAVRGALTFATARRARTQGLAALRNGDNAGRGLEVDCSAISQVDSAGLAVLLDWLAEARRAGRPLRYEQLPNGLLGLARISAVDGFLTQGV